MRDVGETVYTLKGVTAGNGVNVNYYPNILLCCQSQCWLHIHSSHLCILHTEKLDCIKLNNIFLAEHLLMCLQLLKKCIHINLMTLI